MSNTASITGDLAEGVRAVLGDRPAGLKITTLAHVLQATCNSYFKLVVRRMVRAGQLVALPGYRYRLR
jgi:hypothetical protein